MSRRIEWRYLPPVHACPADGSAVTRCCGLNPFALGRAERMTNDPALVTCQAKEGTR